MFRFDEKVVVVTGGEMGIGYATAGRFVAAGARVVIAGIDESAGTRAAEELGDDARFVRADVTSASDAAALAATVADTFGPVDILVNNAGIIAKGDVVSLDEATWRRTLDVNITGMFIVTKHLVPQMIDNHGGVIVNVASEAGLVAIPNQVAYNVSKAAVIMFTKSLALDLAPYSIRANAVCPGTTLTPLVEEHLAAAVDREAALRERENRRPLKRLGKPDEIAVCIMAMAADELGYATGSVWSIDGGYTAQ